MNKITKFLFTSALSLAAIPASVLAFNSSREVEQVNAEREREVIDVESHNSFNMKVVSSVLSWDAQDKATGYKVTLKNLSLEDITSWESNLTAVPIISYLDQDKIDTGKYVLRVDALGIDKFATMPYFYMSNVDKLANPCSLQWLGNNAIWEYVEDASSYTLNLYNFDGLVKSIPNATCPTDLSSFSPEDGWTFTVKALGNGTLSSKRDSEIVESPKKGSGDRVIQPYTSKNMFKMKIDSKGVLSWNAFPNAKSYHISLKNMNLIEVASWDVTNTAAPIISYMDHIKCNSGQYVMEVSADLAPKNPAKMTYYYTSNVNQLESPTNLQWIGDRAAWDSVEGATLYNIVVYNYEDIVTEQTIPGCLFNCSEYSPKDGWTFKVRALSNGTVSAKRDSKFSESGQLVLPKAVFTVELFAYDLANKAMGGGSLELITDKDSVQGLSIDALATEGKQVTVKAEAELNYKFIGWKEETPFAYETVSSIAEYSFTANRDIFLYAVFQQAFTVSFDPNGGTGTMEDETDKYGEYTLPACEFTAPAGQKFVGWSLTQDGEELLLKDSKIDVNADLMFYAIYENYAFTQQPVDNAAATTTEDDKNVISPEWNVNFAATKYEVYEDDVLYSEINKKWFDISYEVEGSHNYFIRAYYDDTNYVESNPFTLTWADEIVDIVYALGDHGVGSNMLCTAKKNSEHYLLGFNDTGIIPEPGYSFDHWEISGVEKNPGEAINANDFTVVVAIYSQSPVSGLTAKYNGIPVVAGNSLNTDDLYIALKYENGSVNELDYHQAGFYIGNENIDNIAEYIFDKTGIIQIRVVSEEKEAVINIEVTGYQVSFSSNGGGSAMNTIFNQYGEVELPICGYSAPFGKEFAGWKLNNEGELIQAGAKVNVTEDVCYFAQWKDSEPEKLDVSYYGGNVEKGSSLESSLIMISLTYHNGDKVDVNVEDAEFYLGEDKIDNIATYKFDIAKQYDVTVKYAGLTAHMMINVPVKQYTVTFNPGSGTGVMNPDVHDEGEYHLPSCSFDAPEGMEFDYWTVNEEHKEVGEVIELTGDVTVVAVWKNLPEEPEEPEEPEDVYYFVHFNPNGGTGEQDDDGSGLLEGEEYELPECSFTAPAGKVFDCWEINGESYNPGDTITVDSDKTIKAIWKDAGSQGGDTPSTPDTPTSEPAKKKGCGGSVIAASSLISIVSLAGAVLLFAKRKQD